MKENRLQRLLDQAEQHNSALVAVNVSNVETIKAALHAAESTQTALILQVAPLQLDFQGIDYDEFVELVSVLARRHNVDYALHLDHAEEVEHCLRAIDAGFDSVMFDGSKQSYDQNLQGTKAVCYAAHRKQVLVEAELGRVLGNEAGSDEPSLDDVYTDPQLAKAFVEETQVDLLAVAIGNAHGFHVGPPKLDFERLNQIRLSISRPIVLHGGTGIPVDDIRQSIALGVRKINYFTELDSTFMNAIKQEAKENPSALMIQSFAKAQRALSDDIIAKMTYCSSAILGKATTPLASTSSNAYQPHVTASAQTEEVIA
ncbi:class II fructose-bisphosphate aldolase [Thaumasiovibrio subtropicus]|uniref:class II fructose-bisphosphate aldolase n=1 Tax=Thaumasiovibrio subtropicus TaxID=1891207 RepID=UPI000B34EDBF|nr:class II fructose-bisphosphate aldolase [Thaumasiovibrio subtropicus]